MKVAIVTSAINDPERMFGAERHFLGMVHAFEQKVDTTWIPLPLSEASWEDVLQSYLRCYELDLSAYDLVVSTKNPTFMVQHPNHICWLLHQIRVFYDRFDDEYGHLPAHALAEKRQQRETIHQLDNLAFQRIRKIFTNGSETAQRLKRYNGFDAEVLYPPVLSEGHYCAGQDYFLLPGRLHRWKRVDLALRAMQHVKSDVPLLIPGTGEDEPYFRELARNDPRIAFLGFVTDQQLLDLYANALAVLFVPKDEDFGYVTVEAMLSHKPVIVCTDSGEPARLVENGRSGFVVKPDPALIATAMSILLADRKLAHDMGEAAYKSTPSQSWDTIVERLLDGATNGRARSTERSSRTSSLPRLGQTPREPVPVLVTDNQVLEPAVGGARIRVKEICKGLAAHFPTEYIGAFDWEGPGSTDDWPLPTWHSRVFALSHWQYKFASKLQKHVPGGSVIDVAFPWMTRLSREFVRALRASTMSSEVVVFTHPWVYPLAKDLLGEKVVIYDAHNFEWGLRSDLLSSTVIGRKLAANVKRVEGDLVKRSDQVWVCSWEDADAMAQAYGVTRKRFRLVPNSADTHGLVPADSHQRDAAKRTMGWEGRSVVAFVGSGGYRPNTEAAAFIIEELAPQFPETVFAIAGSVKEDYLRSTTAAELAERFAPPRVPCCLGVGWYEVEDWGARKQARWTAPEFTVETFRRGGMLTLRVKSPNRNHVTVRQSERKILDSALVEGENTLVIEYPMSGTLRFQLRHEHRDASDPRTLGCAVLSLDWQSHEGNGASLPLQRADLQALLPGNVELLGVVPENKLYTVLHAADVALNPVEMGSGTNLKLLQYMAAALPVISTEAGVRGIERGGELCVVSPRAAFAAALQEVLRYPNVREALGNSGREEVERNYDWRVVTNRAAEDVSKLLKYRKRNEPPFFSVVIPTYERPDRLARALTALSSQTFPDFEVVVVDQSHPPVQVPAKLQNAMRVKYIHSTELGPALARNKGWKSAAGLVIAFTDDDCIPEPDWLENAARHFDEHLIAGLEGRVRSKEVGNPLYRTVCNVGFEGIGYMTANMFYRRDLLSKVDGFDERFKFAFREDTDLAWRVMEYGEIPFAADAAVFHPPHRVEIERESPAERAKMFSVDPILFERHPRRYIDLACREGHYRNMIGFWQHFVRGLTEYESHPPVHELLRRLRDYDPDWWRSVSGMAADSDGQGLDARDLTALRSLMHAVTY
jgi:glycosyltransferase involved in cell wall biosynthesis